jgi:hypothetical protein
MEYQIIPNLTYLGRPVYTRNSAVAAAANAAGEDEDVPPVNAVPYNDDDNNVPPVNYDNDSDEDEEPEDS